MTLTIAIIITILLSAGAFLLDRAYRKHMDNLYMQKLHEEARLIAQGDHELENKIFEFIKERYEMEMEVSVEEINDIIKQHNYQKQGLMPGGFLGSNEARFEGQQRSGEKIVNCLCCKHCLPPFERGNGQICTLPECHFEEA